MAKKFVGQISSKADADDEHNHEPDGKGVQHALVSVGFIGQHGQDDETDEHQPRDLPQIIFTNGMHELVQAFFALKQHHDTGRDDDGHDAVAHDGDDARRESNEQRHLGGEAGIRLRLAQGGQIAGDDHGADGDQRRSDDPAAISLGHDAAQRTKEAGQREGADSGDSIVLPFTLKTDQQAEADRHGEGLEKLGGFSDGQGHALL